MAEKIHAMHGRDHCPGGADPIPCLGGGPAKFEIKVFEDDVVVTPGDAAWILPLGQDLDASVLIGCEAFVTTASSSGGIQVQLRNITNGNVDMLSTKLNIDPNEKSWETAATQPVINLANDDVSSSDEIAIDVDAAGVGAKGLTIILYFALTADAAIAIAGAQGPPGGITTFEGPWVTATGYSIGDAVSHNGSSYVALTNHTSGASTEPGVGGSWQTAWMLLAGNQQLTVLTVILDASPSAISTGIKAFVEVPFAATITQVAMFSDAFGSVVVDIWKDTYANFPPTVADTITAASKPTMSGAQKMIDTILSGWTTSVAAGDILAFNVDSLANFSRLTISLTLRRI
jgi:hypothetical protein